MSEPDYGPKPVLEWIAVAACEVDSKYQRDTGSRRSQNLIAKIVTGFRWSRFGVVLLVRVEKSYRVIDGQHRVEACRQLGLARIPAVVLPHATVEAAAADFVEINRDRVAVTPLHIHHAQLAAGDPVAVEIDRVCQAAKIVICRYPTPLAHLKSGETLAIGTIARMVREFGPKTATRVLQGLRAARGGDAPGAINARAVREALIGASAPRIVSEAKRRPCLKCAKVFRSEGAHQRLCENCRRGSA